MNRNPIVGQSHCLSITPHLLRGVGEGEVPKWTEAFRRQRRFLHHRGPGSHSAPFRPKPPVGWRSEGNGGIRCCVEGGRFILGPVIMLKWRCECRGMSRCIRRGGLHDRGWMLGAMYVKMRGRSGRATIAFNPRPGAEEVVWNFAAVGEC